LSTPNGVGNWFHKMWTESESGLNNMNRISIPWQLHPERDQKWKTLAHLSGGAIVLGALIACILGFLLTIAVEFVGGLLRA